MEFSYGSASPLLRKMWNKVRYFLNNIIHENDNIIIIIFIIIVIYFFISLLFYRSQVVRFLWRQR